MTGDNMVSVTTFPCNFFPDFNNMNLYHRQLRFLHYSTNSVCVFSCVNGDADTLTLCILGRASSS